MVKLVTDFSGTEYLNERRVKLNAISDFWLGSGVFATLGTYGVLRSQFNEILSTPIENGELASSWKDKLNTLNDTRAVIEEIAGSTDYFWWSAYEAYLNNNIYNSFNGGVPVTSGVALNCIYNTSDLVLGNTKSSVASLTALANTTMASVGASKSATANADGTFCLSQSLGSSIQNILHYIVVTWSNNTGGILYCDLGNITSQIGSGSSGTARFLSTPTSLTNINIYISAGTGAGRTFTVDSVTVQEVLNDEKISYLTQNTSNLRPALSLLPATAVRNHITSSDRITGWNNGNSITAPTNVTNDIGGISDWVNMSEATGGSGMRWIPPGTITELQVNELVTGSCIIDTNNSVVTSGSHMGFSIGRTGEWNAGVYFYVGTNFKDVGIGYNTGNVSVVDLVSATYEDLGSGLVRWTITVRAKVNGDNFGIIFWPGVPINGTMRVSQVDLIKGGQRLSHQRTITSYNVNEVGVSQLSAVLPDYTDDFMTFNLPASKNLFPDADTLSNLMPGGGAIDGFVPSLDPNILIEKYVFTTGTTTQAMRWTRTFIANQTVTISFDAVSISGNTNLSLDLENNDTSSTIILTNTVQRYSWTVTPAGARAWLDFHLAGPGTVAIGRMQVEVNSAETTYEGDLRGTGIVAGRNGIWAANVRIPRLTNTNTQFSYSGNLLPNGNVVALSAPVIGAWNDPNKGFTDLMLFNRVLTEAEIARIIKRLRGSGAGRYWNINNRSSNLITNSTFTNSIAGYTPIIADLFNYNNSQLQVMHNNASNAGRARYTDPIIKKNTIYNIKVDFISTVGDATGARIQVGDVNANVANAPTIPSPMLSIGTNNFYIGTYTTGTPLPLGYIGLFADGGTTAGSGGAIFDNFEVYEIYQDE